jgi:glyoxylase-like metal-dependent hydrolase (beta-lactamase superfamily II)
MKVNQDLTVIKLPMEFGGNTHDLNLSLIVDDKHGVAIVDTGMPGSADAILAKLEELGYKPSDLKKILVTHHDIDHIGSIAELKEKTGAEVYASIGEKPYVEGDLPFQKADPERLKQMPQLAEMFAKFRPAKVEHALEFGDVIDFAGGVKLIGTPGHTKGHTSYYLQRTKALVAGDAMTASDGKLNGPNPGATPDFAAAKDSVRDLVPMDIETIVAYHGGIVTEDVPAQLQRVAAE